MEKRILWGSSKVLPNQVYIYFQIHTFEDIDLREL